MNAPATLHGRLKHRLHSMLSFLRNARIIHRGQLYQYWEQEHLRRFFSAYAVDCVFDVGANHGQYARMIRRHAGFRGTIISFEPNPQAAAILRKAASGDPKWIVIEQALSTENGTARFNVMAESQFSSLSEPSHADTAMFADKNKVSGVVTTTTETLSTAFRRLRAEIGFTRPFLKLDTQGFDVKIIDSSPDVLDQFIGLQSELAIKKLYAHSVDFRDAISAYERHGFVLSCFVPNNGGHFPLLVETDCIMVHRNWLPSESRAAQRPAN